MTEDVSQDLPTQDEFETLKNRAAMLGIKYHPSIKLEALREKVNTYIKSDSMESGSSESTDASPAETLRKEVAKLIRIRLTCMNPAKKEWDGEVISVGNSTVGTFKKYIPFNADEGWHVPKIIYDFLCERQCQVFTTVTNSRGDKVRKGKLIKEFSIEVLPQLTEAELQELARRQAMSRSIGD